MLSAQDLRNHLWTDGWCERLMPSTVGVSETSPVEWGVLLVKGDHRLQTRFGCSASGSVGQAEDGPPWAQEGRLELGYISLLQVQVTSRGGAVKHLVGATTGKQWTWGHTRQCGKCLWISIIIFWLLTLFCCFFYLYLKTFCLFCFTEQKRKRQ